LRQNIPERVFGKTEEILKKHKPVIDKIIELKAQLIERAEKIDHKVALEKANAWVATFFQTIPVIRFDRLNWLVSKLSTETEKEAEVKKAPERAVRRITISDTLEARQATTVGAFDSSEGRGNDVKVVVGIPIGMNRANVQSTVSAVNRGLARNGFGRIEDNKQVITFEIDRTDAEKTRQNQEKATQKAQEGLEPDGRIVLFAPQMEKGPQLAGKAQEQYKGQGHIAIVPDAYTDSSPEQNIYPDVMLRVALGRDIAFYYSGKDPQGTLARINNILTKVIDGFAPIGSINDLLNVLKPLRIRPIDFKTITEWQKAQEAVATSL
ncbi:hypothetical protein KKH05_01765, partial [Patescibacteria group bacterium]|nr:hypothetical protein [Patescibacteria group bacterium]